MTGWLIGRPFRERVRGGGGPQSWLAGQAAELLQSGSIRWGRRREEKEEKKKK